MTNDSKHGNDWGPMAVVLDETEPKPATLDDAVPLLARIADALEAQVRPNACGELHPTGMRCVLDDRHVGQHVSGDGRRYWLDEE